MDPICLRRASKKVYSIRREISHQFIRHGVNRHIEQEPPMSQLMNRDDFRTALENAIKGKSANKAPFSIAWASGKLSRDHLARWAENHYHYVGPFADYLAYIYAQHARSNTEAKDFLLQNMYEEEIGGDRHTDLLIRFAEACGTTRERVRTPTT